MEAALILPEALNLIGGVWRPAASGREMAMNSPIDGAPFAAIAESGPEDVDAAIARAAKKAEESPIVLQAITAPIGLNSQGAGTQTEIAGAGIGLRLSF